MRQNSPVQPCPARGEAPQLPRALLSSYLLPAGRWGPSISHENAVLQFLEEPTCALHHAREPHMESCARAAKGRPRTPQHIHSTVTG